MLRAGPHAVTRHLLQLRTDDMRFEGAKSRVIIYRENFRCSRVALRVSDAAANVQRYFHDAVLSVLI
ncbi:hypothetical protein MYCOZU2_05204 [Mycobacterium intracellulare subsp. chimaera]|uniref:Uncharacterized protein n=1 Tax=Mycobacterium intracellulare subsp. chimaera TaxID=222805 RepID=A0A7U5RY51_MYCIT|nr:hypothetical protein MYCOZU2_05204 [Mycobacterium intracellulare subsp. chimaera]